MLGSRVRGAVAYEVDALAGPIVHCHCHTCRKAHAAPFATTARVNRAGFRWIRGEGPLAHSNPPRGNSDTSAASADPT
ncbi:MAG: GFA family protein [Burkholderiaceae bacterium]